MVAGTKLICILVGAVVIIWGNTESKLATAAATVVSMIVVSIAGFVLVCVVGLIQYLGR